MRLRRLRCGLILRLFSVPRLRLRKTISELVVVVVVPSASIVVSTIVHAEVVVAAPASDSKVVATTSRVVAVDLEAVVDTVVEVGGMVVEVGASTVIPLVVVSMAADCVVHQTLATVVSDPGSFVTTVLLS